jgi:uncharacterized OB-fold protein
LALEGEYMGRAYGIGDEDPENLAFFEWCGRHELRLQRWQSNGLLSYPPTTASPWDGSADYEWAPVEGRGTVVSYFEVHHAIHPAFRDKTPYLTLLVELDAQRGEPTEHEALRIVGNLVTPEGELAPPDVVKTAGIGSRVRIVYVDMGAGFALPQWTLDADVPQPTPWRYPGS